jgi:hypothetical protein
MNARRVVLAWLVLVGLPSTTRARPIVGAIRWDAWFGDAQSTTVGREVERSLGPEAFHDRLPFFARETSFDVVEVRGNRLSVIDTEIAQAHRAGLDYWAFVMYPQDFPSTAVLDLYLHSSHKRDLRFCMIVEQLDDTIQARLLRYFQDDAYQSVLGGRPLLYTIGPQRPDDPKWPDAAARFARLRAAAAAAGLKDPYIVHLWGWSAAKEIAGAVGLDALSAYSLNFDDKIAPYATLARKTEAKWDEWRASGAKVVPLVTTGWDRRPRVLHPVSWEHLPPRIAEIDYFYQPPSGPELATHLRHALDWCARHPKDAEAQAILIYAWNEFDEGGWLVPGLRPHEGTRRLDAIREALTPSRSP